MEIRDIWEDSKLRELWHRSAWYGDYRRMRHYWKKHGLSLKYLLPGRLWLDSVEIVVTTRCNRLCDGCANLMPYYEKPYDLERDLVIRSMRKLNECFDWCEVYKILGGEPFLDPDLKFFLEEVPVEKCDWVYVITNGMVVADDPELLEVLRRKRITVMFSDYSDTQQTQKRFWSLLQDNGISCLRTGPGTWEDYGKLMPHSADEKQLKQQFSRCNTYCKSVLNGMMYYCPRSGHGYDLGVIERKQREYVDLLANSREQNRKQIRKLMWRHMPIEACRYCKRGTDDFVPIPKGS